MRFYEWFSEFIYTGGYVYLFAVWFLAMGIAATNKPPVKTWLIVAWSVLYFIGLGLLFIFSVIQLTAPGR